MSDSSILSLGVDSDLTIAHNGSNGLDLDSAGAIDIDAIGVVTLDSSAGISVDGTDDSNITVDKGGKDLSLGVGGGGLQELVLNSAGTGSNAIDINATAGGVNIDANGALALSSISGTISIGDDAVPGAINIGTGAAAETITVGNDASTKVDINALAIELIQVVLLTLMQQLPLRLMLILALILRLQELTTVKGTLNIDEACLDSTLDVLVL